MATRVHPDQQQHLVQRVRANLVARCRVHPGSRLLVAVSGGSDSVALLRLIAEAAPSLHMQLAAAHFDHGLRPGSAEEARFVRDLAATLDVEAHLGAWAAPQRGEDAARRARHAFLQETAARLGCGAIAFAHQRDDQIETMLLRLARGSGPRGLLGMAWRRQARVDLVRPLLDCSRLELIEYLHARQQTWCEDASNKDLAMSRNRVRHRALPALDAALGPSWREHCGDSLEDLREVWAWLDASAAKLLDQARRWRLASGIELCERPPLQDAPEVLRRAALQRWLESLGCVDLRRCHLEHASRLALNGQTGHTTSLPGGFQLVAERDRLVLVAGTDGADIESSKPSAFRLHTEPVETPFAVRVAVAQHEIRQQQLEEVPPCELPAEAEAVLCADRLEGGLELRTARLGERVRLLGAPGSRKLSRILQDKRIPGRLRRAWPVVADAAGIVWIPLAGVAERCRLDAGSRRALRLALRRLEPEKAVTIAPAAARRVIAAVRGPRHAP